MCTCTCIYVCVCVCVCVCVILKKILSLQTEAILRSYYVSYIVVNTYNNIDEDQRVCVCVIRQYEKS